MDTQDWKVVKVWDLDRADLIELYHSERFGYQVWTICKVRKKHECHLCGKVLLPSTQDTEVYRPLGQRKNQKDRICVACMGAMVREFMTL